MPEDKASYKDSFGELARSVVNTKSYVLGGILGSETERLKVNPETILPLNEATELVPTITRVDFLPFQSEAFKLQQENGKFTASAQYISSASITESFPAFRPQNLLGNYSNSQIEELRKQVEAVINNHIDIWGAYAELTKRRLPQEVRWDLRYAYLYTMYSLLVDPNAAPEQIVGISKGQDNIMMLRIPSEQKILLGIPAGEKASSRGASAVLLFNLDTRSAVDKLGDFIKTYSANGLNALFAILLSKELTPGIENLNPEEDISRYSLFYCLGQRYDRKNGQNKVFDAVAEIVVGQSPNSKDFRIKD